MYFENSQGAEQFIAAASAPVGTVTSYEDSGIPSSSTALFTGATYTYLDITVAQFANAGAALQHAAVYLVFNSADPATDLDNPAVRTVLYVEAGRGMSRRKIFAKEALASCHYKSTNTAADLVLRVEAK